MVHDEDDRKRLALETKRAALQEAKEAALAKLTPNEKVLLKL